MWVLGKAHEEDRETITVARSAVASSGSTASGLRSCNALIWITLMAMLTEVDPLTPR